VKSQVEKDAMMVARAQNILLDHIIKTQPDTYEKYILSKTGLVLGVVPETIGTPFGDSPICVPLGRVDRATGRMFVLEGREITRVGLGVKINLSLLKR